MDKNWPRGSPTLYKLISRSIVFNNVVDIKFYKLANSSSH
jgi:hypothetical protein